MMDCRRQVEFKNKLGSSLFDFIKEWVSENMEPDDIFDEKDLLKWAENQDPGDLYSDSDLRAWVQRNSNPEEVFSDADLEDWAIRHGFVKRVS